jgi:uncharacterized damage-inducible protein DinB
MNRELIETYVTSTAKVREAVQGLTREELQARPGPGKWSIQEVVIHLVDSDDIAIDRMKRILTEDNPSLLYADETAYIDRLHPHEHDLGDALTFFEINRRQFARVLRKLPDEAFQRAGTHNRKGRVTVAEMLASYVRHIDEHLEYVRGKRANLDKPLA